MFIFLKDYINKILKQDNSKEELSKKGTNKEENIQKDIGSNKKESKKESKKNDNKKEKNSNLLNRYKSYRKNKKEKKRKRKKFKIKRTVTIFSVIMLLIFVLFLIFYLLLLLSKDEFVLDGKIQYDFKNNRYNIEYEIEELWNTTEFLDKGTNVCIPYYFNKNDTVVNAKSNCIKGVIVEGGNRVKIKYEIKDVLTKEELSIYGGKDILKSLKSNNISIKFKTFLNRYQIIKIETN